MKNKKLKNKKYYVSMAAAAIFMGLAYYYPAETVIAFFLGWLIIIPAFVVIYAIHGFRTYRKDLKNRIVVSIKPNEKLRSILRIEEELRKEKEVLLKEESKDRYTRND